MSHPKIFYDIPFDALLILLYSMQKDLSARHKWHKTYHKRVNEVFGTMVILKLTSEWPGQANLTAIGYRGKAMTPACQSVTGSRVSQ